MPINQVKDWQKALGPLAQPLTGDPKAFYTEMGKMARE